MSQRFAYRPELDGLRAVAVLAVILFHLGFGVSGGFVGVDVFFVLSGYLITAIILADLNANRFSLKTFWMKRLRRLVPANYLLLIVTLCFGLCVLLPGELNSLVKTQVAQVLLFANFHFAFRIDYFDPIASLNPLLHTWSLAVEEHFYLLLPMLLGICFKRSLRTVATVVIILLAGSFVFSLWRVHHEQALAFYLLPSRAWELLMGCSLAFVLKSPPTNPPSGIEQKVHYLTSLVSIGVLCYCFVTYDENTLFPGASALLPCLATAGVIYGTRSKNLVSRLLSIRWVVGIGLISYSLYLWHWPIIVFTKIAFVPAPSPILAVGLVALCFLLAFVSWKYVEQPFRKRKWFASDKQFLGFVMILGGFLSATPFLIVKLNGLPGRFGESLKDVVHATVSERFQIDEPTPQYIKEHGLPVLGSSDQPPTFLLWGDSHAAAISEMVDGVSRDLNVSGFIASRNAILPLLHDGLDVEDGLEEWSAAILGFVREKKIKNVILTARWELYLRKRRKSEPYCSRDAFGRVFRETIDQLMAMNTRVWILPQVPHQKLDVSRAMIIAKSSGEPVPTGVTLEQYNDIHGEINSVFESREFLNDVFILDVVSQCFKDGKSLIGQPDGKYYTDKNHLSLLGSHVLIRPLLEPVLKQIADDAGSTAKKPVSSN